MNKAKELISEWSKIPMVETPFQRQSLGTELTSLNWRNIDEVLKTQLLKEEKQQLLVTAAGGCGKTTLVEMLCQDENIQGKFKDNIFFVPVSKNLNLMVIVQRLFHHLSDQEPEFQSEEDAINQLRELLTQIGPDPILLILDDVWSGSEFRLDKFKFDMPNYNIMVTSRTTTFPGFSFTYNLKPLNDDDATKLLLHSASLQDGSSHIPVEVIKEIVSGCGRFPLALKVNGISLHGKPVEGWCSRARKWSNGSFPEDQRIPVPALIDMWDT
uniref:NB-ARC domain-containing protein n=1 Tax=Fagus sylvatica TaxID=28930 RepID=A0A2N9HW74_FAGSY